MFKFTLDLDPDPDPPLAKIMDLDPDPLKVMRILTPCFKVCCLETNCHSISYDVECLSGEIRYINQPMNISG